MVKELRTRGHVGVNYGKVMAFGFVVILVNGKRIEVVKVAKALVLLKVGKT